MVIAAVALLAGFVAGANAVSAGQATPQVATGYPAYIQVGPCDNLGDVVYSLNNVGGASLGGTPEATPVSLPEGEAGDVIGRSRTDIDASLDELLDGGFAVNMHESAEEMEVYIACGEIAGDPVDGVLTVHLEQQNDSCVAGEALLRDLGNGRSEVTITLTAAPVDDMASPVASPASDS